MKNEIVNYCELDKYASKAYSIIHNVSEEKNLGDINLVNENSLSPFTWMWGGSPCFVKDTKILTNKGYKNIQDIKIGDQVLTHKNRFMEVTDIGSDGEKPIFRVETQGTLPILCTENHPFLIKHKSKIWNNNKRRYLYIFNNPEKVRLFNAKVNEDYIGVPIIPDEHNEFSDLDDETLWLLGRYVADGYIREGKTVVLSIGQNKITQFDNITTPHQIYSHTRSCYRVTFNTSTKLYQVLANNNFGNGAVNKTIPLNILQLSQDKLRIFIEGYMSGDGCNIKNSTIYQATTISKDLAQSLVLAVQKVYRVGCRIYHTKRPKKCIIEDRIVNQHDTYMIRFDLNPKRYRYVIENECIWYPIKKIVDTKEKQTIYNITVKDDHTYTANNCYVGNCQDFSVAGKQAGAMWTCKQCGFQYNPLEAHYTKRDACPQCGSKDIEKTRSSLLAEYLRILRSNHPKVAIYENVKNIVGAKFKSMFDLFIKEIQDYGYNTYYKVLNAQDYGIPQHRERLYIVIIDKNIDNGKFNFPQSIPLTKRLKDMLEDIVEEKYYCTRVYSEEGLSPTITTCGGGNTEPKVARIGGIFDEGDKRHQAGSIWDKNGLAPTLDTMQGGWRQPSIIVDKSVKPSVAKNFKREKGQIANTDKDIYQAQCDSGWQDNKVGINISPTCRAGNDSLYGLDKQYVIRKLTPKECWRLMGFDDEDIDKVKAAGISNSQLYKMAGNSIVVNVLESIYRELYKAMPYLFEEIKICSLFSGIGAFEKAMNRFDKEGANE